MGSKTSTVPLWTRSFSLLIIANLFVFMGFQMLIPTIPPYIQSLGASGIEIGLATTLFSIGAVIIRPFIGYFLEYRERKALVIIGAISLLVITILYPVSQIVFIFLGFRLLHGIGWGWSTTANGTAAVDVVPNARLGEGMGYFGLSATVGMIIAPSLGIFLYQHFQFSIIIVVSTILSAIAILLLVIVKYKTPEVVKNKRADEVQFSFFGSLIEKSSWYPAFVTLMATFGYGTIVTFIVIFSEERGLHQIYLFYLCNAVVATLVRPITGRWFDRKGPRALILICATLTFIALWVLSFATSNIYIIISGILFGAGYGSLIPTLQAWVLQKTVPERRGVANGMFYSAIDLGIGASGLIFGILAQVVSIGTLFQISSFFFLFVIIFTIFSGQKKKIKQTQRVTHGL
ncbi:MFS transporter [Heyndrickxia sp. NPDC080065]|uniref:MFS transporter n=1 Tax=Heyndrickxia sp. NPDC080065 TaxID=3390568 RepID=UPI003D03EB3C